MEDYIRHKRKNGVVHTWPTKLYIPIPLAAKNQFVRVSKFHRLSQAELGAVIVMHYLANMKLLQLAIEEYIRIEAEMRSEFLDEQYKESQADRTFGGVFKSSFPENDEDGTQN